MNADQLTERDYTLGFAVAQPQLLDAADIPTGFFVTQHQREVWESVRTLKERGEPISLAALAGLSSGNGVVSYLGAITTGLIPLKPEDFRRRICRQEAEDLRKRRRTLASADCPDEDEIASLSEEIRRLDLEVEEIGLPDSFGFLKTGAQIQALDIKNEYTIERAVPSRSLVVMPAPGGTGKTHVALAAAAAVSAGIPFLGLETKKRPVYYIDRENPLPVLAERVRKLDIRDVIFWHLSEATRPPKLTDPNWTLYKKVLKPGSLAIFDTLRASFDGKGNDDDVAALVMDRFKELRELGLDIILLHHTSKADDKKSKGSTAWTDLADQVLSLHRHRRQDLKEIDDDDPTDQETLFSLGTGEKSRFAPFRIFLTFDPEAGTFRPADDPKASLIDQLAEHIAGEGLGKNQTAIVAWAKEALGIKKRDSVLALLKRGEGTKWKTAQGFQNARIYEPI